MTGIISILPPNSSLLERNLAETGSAIEQNSPSVIVQVTRYGEARPEYLPYLAWEVSVDRWSDDWSEATKRKVIQESFYVHKRKGTIASLRRVVEPFGYLLNVVEWFEEVPPAQRGTFKLDIGVAEQGITEDVYKELERLIADTKPLSRHMLGLNITLYSQGFIYMGIAAFLGDTTTVYPPSPQPIEISNTPPVHGGTHLIDTMIVSPL